MTDTQEFMRVVLADVVRTKVAQRYRLARIRRLKQITWWLR